jgi:glycosyl-4,4'-diaponeurosporenoate acyltransferase
LFLPALPAVLLASLLWTAIHLGSAWLCLRMGDRALDPDAFLFRARPFEKGGQFYETVFRVSRWKGLLPDGGGLFGRKGFRKKELESLEPEYLRRFLVESARGELTHWLAILPFWVFGLFLPPAAVGFMLFYALLSNLPCIIAQRYNRPRIQRYLRLSQARAARNP